MIGGEATWREVEVAKKDENCSYGRGQAAVPQREREKEGVNRARRGRGRMIDVGRTIWARVSILQLYLENAFHLFNLYH